MSSQPRAQPWVPSRLHHAASTASGAETSGEPVGEEDVVVDSLVSCSHPHRDMRRCSVKMVMRKQQPPTRERRTIVRHCDWSRPSPACGLGGYSSDLPSPA